MKSKEEIIKGKNQNEKPIGGAASNQRGLSSDVSKLEIVVVLVSVAVLVLIVFFVRKAGYEGPLAYIGFAILMAINSVVLLCKSVQKNKSKQESSRKFN